MTINEIIVIDKQNYMNTFGDRIPVCFESGEGITLTATDGKEYKDFFAGIAVNLLGYNHTNLTSALRDQAGKLLHTSNIYYVKNQALLAQRLVENSCADKVFFANTGAEANEGALKLVKKYFYNKGLTNKTTFITLKNSFHGRTLATVAATGQEKYQKPYAPLLERFIHIDGNDLEQLENAVNNETAAVILEPIQGESGVRPLNKEFIALARELCDKFGAFLVFDEVQTGMGRTGKLFGYEHFGVEPDAFTLAKGLGGGVPIGAICAKNELASAFSPGDHGTTFGGNPLSTRAGLVVMDELLNNGVLSNSQVVGEYFKNKLTELKSSHDGIAEVRGAGLMLAVEFEAEVAKEIGQKMLSKGYLVGVVGTKILRLVPPLILTKADVDGFIKVLGEVLHI